jgi:subtilisin family serine protease
MKRLSLALLGASALAALALAPSAANAACYTGNCWGAVAYGPYGSWAYAVDYPARQIAARVAQRNCGGRCNHVLTFQNSCGAYASGPSSYQHYGWGNASTRYQAEAIAMQECNARGPYCAVRVWGCTTR